MSAEFDPYHQWLGISAKDQPPHHYRLLGIDLFESDPNVIETAADRQMVHLRGFQTGKRSEVTQKLLNEVAAAKNTLLDAESKAKYDGTLRRQLAGPASGEKSKTLLVAKSLPQRKPATSPAAVRIESQSKNPVEKQPIPLPWILGISGAGAALVLLLFVGWKLLFPAEDTVIQTDVTQQHIAETDERAPNDVEEHLAEHERSASRNMGDPQPVDSGALPETTERPITDPPLEEPGTNALDAAPQDPQPVVPATEPDTAEPEVNDRPNVDAAGQDAVTTSPEAELTVEAKTSREGTESRPVHVDTPPRRTLADLINPPATPDAGQTLLQVPSDEQQKTSLKLIAELFEKEYAEAKSNEQKAALAEKMIAEARNTRGDSVDYYVLLRVARDIALGVGAVESTFEAIELISQRYEVDGLQMQVQAIEAMREKTQSRPDLIALGKKSYDILPTALEQGDYVTAKRLGEFAATAAKRARDFLAVKEIEARNKLIARAAKDHEEATSASETLKEQPDDPAANRIVGRFLCCYRGDWQEGLPALAKSDDPLIARMAERDLAGADKADDQIALADAWFQLAEGQKNDELWHATFMQRAHLWYEQAAANQLEGLTKAKVDKRLEETAAVTHPTAEFMPREIMPGAPLPTGRWVDVLPWCEPGKDDMAWNWERTTTGNLQTPEGSGGKNFMLPIRVTPDVEMAYQLAVEATVTTDGNAVFTLPVGLRQMHVDFAPQITDVYWVDGKKTAEATRDAVFALNQPFHMLIDVRTSNAGKAMISLSANGVLLRQWGGDQSQLSASRDTDARRPELGAWDATIRFQRVRFRLLSGSAKRVGKPSPLASRLQRSASGENGTSKSSGIPAQHWEVKFDDEKHASQYLEWTGEWEMAADGGKASKGPKSYVRTRHAYYGDISVDLDFSLGRAAFTNTGGCWVTMWGKQLQVTNGWHGFSAKIHIHREGNEVVFVHNGEEKRIIVEPNAWARPTTIEVRYRSRSSHFRRFEVKAQRMIPVN